MTQHDYLLTAVVLVPAVAALVVALMPRDQGRRISQLGAVAAVATLVLAIIIGAEFRSGVSGYQMVATYSWIPTFGISVKLGVDGISLFLVLMTAVLFPIALIGASVQHNLKSFVGWMLLLEAACLGSFLSLDLFLFFVCFELTLVPVYFIIGGWGFERRGYAAIKFFLYTFLGSALFFVGMLGVVFIHARATGQVTFDLVALSKTPGLLGNAGTWGFLAFTAAFAVKAPLFPLHTWSPDAYGESPTAGVVILAAVMAKLGTYGIIRFDFSLFPKASVALAPLLLTLATIGILYGAVVAGWQRDLKRLAAYASLAGMGFIVLGLFAFTDQGLTGGVVQMLNHGIYTTALFLLIGMIYERRKTWQLSDLRGLQRPAPVLAGAFTVVMMAAIGLPGTNGFVGEFLVLLGTFITHRWWAVAATAGVILACVYFLWAFQRGFHGRPRGENARIIDLTVKERLVMAPLLALIVFLGVYPRPVLDRIGPSVSALVHHVEANSHYVQPAVASGGGAPVASGTASR